MTNEHIYPWCQLKADNK